MPKRRFRQLVVALVLVALSMASGFASASTRCLANVYVNSPVDLSIVVGHQQSGPSVQLSSSLSWTKASADGTRAVTGVATATRYDAQVPKDNARRDREYAPVLRFSDGTLAVFTGLFVEKGSADPGELNPVCYHAGDGSNVIGPGQEQLANTAQPDQAGYVAFGKPRVSRVSDITFVLDRGLPSWAVDYIESETAKAMAAYTKALGARKPPLVLVYSSPGEGSYFWGDHLDGSLTLGLYGNWTGDSPGLRRKLQEFIDHEMFHVWNSTMADRVESTSLLPLEGGAELARVLLSFDKTRDVNATLSEVSDAMTRCQLEVASGSIKAMLEESHPGRAPYDCGMTLLFGLSVRRSGSTLDDSAFWHVWNDALKPAYEGGRPYTWEMFLSGGTSDEQRQAAAKAVEVDETGEAFKALISASGFTPVPRRAFPSPLSALAGQRIMQLIMADDCDGRVGFFFTGNGYQLDDSLPTCKSFLGGKVVSALDGMIPWIDPLATADAIAKRCSVGDQVDVSYIDSRQTSRAACPHSKMVPDFYSFSTGKP